MLDRLISQSRWQTLTLWYTHVNESCLAYEWVMPHIWMNHVTDTHFMSIDQLLWLMTIYFDSWVFLPHIDSIDDHLLWLMSPSMTIYYVYQPHTFCVSTIYFDSWVYLPNCAVFPKKKNSDETIKLARYKFSKVCSLRNVLHETTLGRTFLEWLIHVCYDLELWLIHVCHVCYARCEIYCTKQL